LVTAERHFALRRAHERTDLDDDVAIRRSERIVLVLVDLRLLTGVDAVDRALLDALPLLTGVHVRRADGHGERVLDARVLVQLQRVGQLRAHLVCRRFVVGGGGYLGGVVACRRVFASAVRGEHQRGKREE
jgi:hypothetical protein